MSRSSSSSLSSGHHSSTDSTFTNFKDRIESKGFRISSNGLAIYNLGTHKEVGSYIVPLDWEVLDGIPMPSGFVKTARGNIWPKEFAKLDDGGVLQSAFRRLHSGDVVPNGWVESKIGHHIIPDNYYVSPTGTILTQK